jgi:hypothetical protein
MPADVEFIARGPHGREVKELIKRAMRNGGKRRIRRMERREGKREEQE